MEKLDEDLNMPEALAVFWELIKSTTPESSVKYYIKMDEVLGLRLQEHIGVEIPDNILNLAKNEK